MRRSIRLGAVLTLTTLFSLLIAGGVPASGQSAGAGSKGVGAAAIQRLRRDAEGAVTIEVDRATRYVGFARAARGGDLFPGSTVATPRGKARGFFARYPELFGLGDSALVQVGLERDALGSTHVTYEQRYRGVPVFGGVVRAHVDRGNKLTAVNGTLVPNIDLSVDPLLSASQAEQRAIADVRANPPETEDAAASVTGLRAGSTRLEIYRVGLVRNVPGSNQLVYQVEVTNGADVREFVFVHANAGKILNRYSGVHHDLFRRLFEENLETQVWEEGDPFPGDLNEDQENIVRFSGESYRFFQHAFGRDSYDGAGAEMQSVNNDPRINCPNANWNGLTTNYCTGVTPDDVVAHEWGHAYTEFTSNLIYQWQSGALNESYSDIWGETVDLLNGEMTDTPGGTRTVDTCSSFANNWPVVIVNQPSTLGECAAAQAQFGPKLNATGITANVVLSSDNNGALTDGCSHPQNAAQIAGSIALVDRGTCTFVEKAANMQKVGAIGVMVANNVFGPPTVMPPADPSIQIPSVMISRNAGVSLKQALGAGTVNVTMRARTTQGSYRWLMGEDATAFGGAIRDMWDPNCIGDPGKVTDQEYFCAPDDSGGVHANSGVPNHGYALLVEGGTYNGRTISAIGLTRAAHIYWRAQAFYQTPTTDFPDHAAALETACADLVGQRVPNLGVGTQPPGGQRPQITSSTCAQVATTTQAIELRTDPTTQCNFQPLLKQGAPPVCNGQVASVAFEDHFDDAALDGWTLTNAGVFDGWPDLDWVGTNDVPAGGNGGAAYAADPDAGDCGQGADDISGMMSMESPSFGVPGGSMQLSFRHYVSTEQGFDGGNVWISVNGRAYTQVPTAAFLFNPYNQALVTAAGGNTNPMAGQPAFTGTDAGQLVSAWGTSIVDLGATGTRIRAGDTVRLRFDFGMDGCAGIDGWYVDDVMVSVCGTTAAVVEDETTIA